MKKLCPNLDREDGLDTVLEVPIPHETSAASVSRGKDAPSSSGLSCGNVMRAWMRPHRDRSAPSSSLGRAAELHLMLGVVGAPLVPVPVEHDHRTVNMITRNIKEDPIEVSRTKYIVKQYVAAVGGEKAVSGVSSMYAMGKVRMMVSASKSTSRRGGGDQVGGFVVWQKSPELWCLELVVAGCKLTAGCDGRVAWRQAPWQSPRASQGPPRPLRRSLQGLDPRSTASLFSDAVHDGEKTTTNGEACFVLRLDADPATCRARSSASVEVVRHTLWGHFSQRTGLLVRLEDAHLLRIVDPVHGGAAYWETNTESAIGDYRAVDGVHAAHAGRTAASLVRSREGRGGHVRRTRSHVEEAWTIEEVGFNIRGLSTDCFLPPSDLKEEKRGGGDVAVKDPRPRGRDRAASVVRFGPSQVAAVDSDDSDSTEEENERL